jgi:Icc-related predicted phosphoesterase
MNESSKAFRIAATGDLHYTKNSKGAHQELFTEASKVADVLLLCGDLTDYGTVEEARILGEDLKAYCTIPTVGVVGNHDFESGQVEAVTSTLCDFGVKMLEGECVEIGPVGFAGVCGFGGGFGKYMLNAWGETLIKTFAHEAGEQAMKLERALARLQSPHRVVLLHYSPLRETVEGEPPEIMPFLGSSRLEAPLNSFKVDVAFHGHAHRGAPSAQTSMGIPVFNVSIPVLKASEPHRPGFRLVELTTSVADKS